MPSASHLGTAAELLSPEEVERSRTNMLRTHSAADDLWVFAYGALMWNDVLVVAESRPARVEGYRRSFCIGVSNGRATADNPGLMLALVPGGSCAGVAHRISFGNVDSETTALWSREMPWGVYRPAWLELDIGRDRVPGLALVLNPECSDYLPNVSLAGQAERIAHAEGPFGTNREYLFQARAALDEAGLGDDYIDALCTLVSDLRR